MGRHGLLAAWRFCGFAGARSWPTPLHAAKIFIIAVLVSPALGSEEIDNVSVQTKSDKNLPRIF
jgi:hypothetical protein